ncbi:NACHT, LRR and PYD domains-containing protein 3 [Protobothrops mucrosquamatus]|uniref:NACHT, LRR and PYD domains-containing protein 3 n=1 Tax=Protobothrops mucrosquamatus TaxID=103944 RepID=UPI000775C239|nr:NACHT, LRR and PYD domains-containing protein 3 [Protobothrops mucrosquamatus]
MNNTVRDHLSKALDALEPDQFEVFKWRLKCINHDGTENIPVSSLQEATRLEVVDLLIQYYEEDAVNVCIRVLQQSNINNVARNLKEALQVADVDAHQLISDYRNYIKKRFEKMKDPNAVPGEYVLLNQRYSKLIILDDHRSKEEREHEIRAIGRKHVEIISKRAKSSTSLEKLFNPDKNGFIPHVVVLQGAAGIGKTMMAKKIMLDWASQKLYQDKFHYVFYISCREMNLLAETEESSIEDIISKQWPKCHAVKNILQNEKEILFIIDGFDELKYSFDLSENYFCTKTRKKEPVRIILSSLFQKKLLPESYLIITTRPTALEKLDQCLGDSRYFEILGFSTQERKEFFYKFFENKAAAIEAFSFVKQNSILFTMCVIPLVSWIICTVMKQEMERGKDLLKTPCTLTEIYMLYFSSLLKFHHKESKQAVQSYVKGLCSLAAQGVWNQETLFLEEKLKTHSLDQGDPLPLFLNQSIFKSGIGRSQTYSFIHLSFQEFFAALFYLLEEGEEQHSPNQDKSLQTLLERHKSFRPNFAIGFHFLFGFLNEEKRMTVLKQEFGWKISPKNKEFLLDYVKNDFKKSRHNFQLQKEMFSYLYEIQDDNFVKDAVHEITEIDYECNSDMDLMILAYCVQHCHNLTYLNVEVPELLYITETEFFLENKEWSLDEKYVEDFFKALKKLTELRVLSLVGWSFTESCSRDLAEVFKNNQRLKILALSLDDTDDTTAELLCKGLQDEECKIETLVFRGENMTEFCSRKIAEVFSKNKSLRELNFHLFYPDDKVVKILCKGLQDKDCKVEKLGLAGDFLTKLNSTHLAEVLRKNIRLREIEFSLREIDDEGAELMYDLLKHSKYGLETLQLVGQFLSESGSRDPAEVLKKSEELKELVLPLKKTFDKVIELLPELLKYPECIIDALWYLENFLAKSNYRLIEEILRKNQKLEEFFKNDSDDPDHPDDSDDSDHPDHPDHKTLKFIFDEFRDLADKMQMTQLAGQFLIEYGSTHLTHIFRKDQRLRELDSFLNNVVVKTIELLLLGFKEPECTKKGLGLLRQFLNDSYHKVFAILEKNQGLRDLESFVKNIFAQPIAPLLEELKNPECIQATLQYIGHLLNEACSFLLAYFSKNQEMREIESFLRNTNDQTTELLCEGLKESNIETL